ncbi:MAG: 3'-5' exonuclease [Succinivibrio sp.]
MSTDTIFPLAEFDAIRQHPENYRLLKRIPLTIKGVDTHFPIILNEKLEGEKVCQVVFLDTETTGIDNKTCSVIELGMVKATMSLDRKLLLSVDRFYDEFEQPDAPIPPEITRLTGITDEMVEGHRFDEEMVANFLAGRPLVVAHNAGFDRPFFEKRFKTLQNLSWACSLKEIPWSFLGFPGSKLEYLNNHLGYFYDAHRAYVDCLALLWVMYLRQDAFSKLIESATSQSVRVVVQGNTFSINKELKRLEFRFDGNSKTWYREVSLEDEARNLKDTLISTYRQGDVYFEVNLFPLNAKNRYK